MKFLVTLFFLSFSTTSYSIEEKLKLEDIRYSVKDDFFESIEWAYKGSYKQFQGTQNLIFAGLAVASTLYFLDNDDYPRTTRSNEALTIPVMIFAGY